MHMDPLLPKLVASAALALGAGALATRLRMPHVIAYLVLGIFLGPAGIDLFGEEEAVARVGEFGVVLLLFFAGMEVDLDKLITGWRISVLGTLFQIGLSVLIVLGLGTWLDWPLARTILFGFILSLSSTAVVLSMLTASDEMATPAGGDTVGVLLVQDVAVVGMLIAIGFLGGEAPSSLDLGLQGIGAVATMAVVVALARGLRIRLPLAGILRKDHELQVFAAFGLCFGMATLSAFLGLSSALGAFLAGLVVASAKETDWVHRVLDPFRVLLVAVFFVSVGMLIRPDVLAEHWKLVVGLVIGALVVNTLLNALILRGLGRGWQTSLYVGALLSMIGEFSFVLAAVGRHAGIISEQTNQLAIGVIAGTLLLGPAWIAIWRPHRGRSVRPVGEATH